MFELTDLTPDNLRPRMPMKMPKTMEMILEQEEERRGEAVVKEEQDPSECVSSTNGENKLSFTLVPSSSSFFVHANPS